MAEFDVPDRDRCPKCMARYCEHERGAVTGGDVRRRAVSAVAAALGMAKCGCKFRHLSCKKQAELAVDALIRANLLATADTTAAGRFRPPFDDWNSPEDAAYDSPAADASVDPTAATEER